MKKIEAFIKPTALSSVISALHRLKDVSGVSVTDVWGFGRGRVNTEFHKIEIYCADSDVHRITEVIVETAHTGSRGDGKIFVSRIDEAIRISTLEHGEAAV